jgi:hypothetical protein
MPKRRTSRKYRDDTPKETKGISSNVSTASDIRIRGG